MHTVFVIPAHNEQAILRDSVARLHAWAKEKFVADEFAIVISENASKDGTDLLGSRLAKEYPEVILLSSNMAGKGGAIKWGMALLNAKQYVMMDADLSVDLTSVGTMLDASREDTLTIASRRMPDSQVTRPHFRALVTAIYAGVFNSVLGLGIRDAQCGCKILPIKIRDSILHAVRDDDFFFDTELLARTHQAGFRIQEMAVKWQEHATKGRGSSVRITRTSLNFLKKLAELKRDL